MVNSKALEVVSLPAKSTTFISPNTSSSLFLIFLISFINSLLSITLDSPLFSNNYVRITTTTTKQLILIFRLRLKTPKVITKEKV
jgi:hypothetical protein